MNDSSLYTLESRSSSYTFDRVRRPVVHVGLEHPLNIGLDIKRVYDDESCLVCLIRMGLE